MSESTTGKDTQRICKAIKSVYSGLGRRENTLRSGTSLCATLERESKQLQKVLFWEYTFTSPRIEAPQAAHCLAAEAVLLAAGLRKTRGNKYTLTIRRQQGLSFGTSRSWFHARRYNYFGYMLYQCNIVTVKTSRHTLIDANKPLFR